VLIEANPFSAEYLEVKRARMHHDLPQVDGGARRGRDDPDDPRAFRAL
jgi:hypothetical protein